METQHSIAEVLGSPIEMSLQRATGELKDRDKKTTSIQERRTKYLSNAQLMSEFDCSFGLVQASSGMTNEIQNLAIDWFPVHSKNSASTVMGCEVHS